MAVAAVYPTDISVEQWAVVQPILTRIGKPGRPLLHDLHCIFNGCLYIARESCCWRSLPKDAYPPWTIVFWHFQRWTKSGLLEQVTHTLNEAVRIKMGREMTPSTLIVDAHSLKSRNGGEAIGFDGNKKVHGRKNQILIDTLGLVWGVHTHAANLSDTYEAVPLFKHFLPLLPRATRIYFDKGYRGTAVSYLECLDIASHIPDKGLGEKVVGFQPEPLRWRVERTIAWVTDCRRLGASFERTISSCEGFAWLAGCYVALGKLVGRKPWAKKKNAI